MAAMPLSSLSSGSDVFLDANILVYALCGRSRECLNLLLRCASEEITGATTLEVVNEATHKLMLAEAFAKGLITQEKASALNKRPRDIRGLEVYWNQTLSILNGNLVIMDIDESRLHSANDVRTTEGLLTNDSLIVAAMRDYGLSALASNDSGFDHVGGLIRFVPSDLS